MAEEPAKAVSQFQIEPIDCNTSDVATPEKADWTRHLEVKVVTGVLAALFANGLRAFLSLVN